MPFKDGTGPFGGGGSEGKIRSFIAIAGSAVALIGTIVKIFSSKKQEKKSLGLYQKVKNVGVQTLV
ncbi:MAG: hypothetical protein KKF44_09145 [Nanoarchaeota archaeon]|nr:hypothetical protein [Nanoarchaeota archaeon]